MSIKSTLITLLSLGVIGSNANIYTTAPVASTVCTGAKPCTLKWNDDGTVPLSSAFGQTSIGLYVGAQTTQSLVQDFGSLDPNQINTISPVINPGACANGGNYFIRFQSLTATDATGAPLLAFSSKFTINGMTGTVTQAQSDAINGIAPGASVVTTTLAPIVANSTITSSSPAKTSITSASKMTTSTLASTSSVANANASSANSSSNSTKAASGAESSIVKLGLGAMIGVLGVVALLA